MLNLNVNKRQISGKERKEIIRKTDTYILNIEDILPKKGSVMKFMFSKSEALIVVEQKTIPILELNNQIIPNLKFMSLLEMSIPQIVVDIGAIRFVTNGADIMRPGIVDIDDNVLEGSLVLIVEERNKAPLSIGRSLYDAVDMRSKDSGKCIKNIHWLKDKWFSYILD